MDTLSIDVVNDLCTVSNLYFRKILRHCIQVMDCSVDDQNP